MIKFDCVRCPVSFVGYGEPMHCGEFMRSREYFVEEPQPARPAILAPLYLNVPQLPEPRDLVPHPHYYPREGNIRGRE